MGKIVVNAECGNSPQNLRQDGRTYAFRDVYKFNGSTNNAKIKEMISYIIESEE